MAFIWTKAWSIGITKHASVILIDKSCYEIQETHVQYFYGML